MKRNYVIILTFLLILSLLCSCGKETAPNDSSPTSAISTQATTATTAIAEESVPATVPETEPVSDFNTIVIDSDIYTLPIYVKDITNNGWEIVDSTEELNSEGEINAVNFARNGLILSANLTGTPGANIYDEGVYLDTVACRVGDDNASATLAGAISTGMAYEELITTLEDLGYEDIQSFPTAKDGTVVIAYQDEYMLEIHCSDIVNTLIVVMT